MVMSKFPIGSVIGVEIEYMLVDRDTLNVQPMSDIILSGLAGQIINEVTLGEVAVSNELVLHVLELKNNGPKPLSTPIENQFQATILQLQPLLEQHHLQLLPSGAHPWMDPLQETKRWPHGYNDIYQQYNRIFNCQGHGWSNLQSMHVNLPYANDEEFNRLHNTIRLLLPLLPAIAASTPLLDGKPTGFLDTRLNYYGQNQARIPSITGDVIPDFIASESQYQEQILQPMYRDISPHDPQKLLQYDWLNSRGAMPKFADFAIEIRIIDSQECVNADIAIARAIHAILHHWDQNAHLHLEKSYPTKGLKAIYDQTLKDGLSILIDDSSILEQWQLPKRTMTVRDVWSLLIEAVSPALDDTCQRTLEHILRYGNLSERILQACHNDFSRANLTQVYRQLGDCLLANESFPKL